MDAVGRERLRTTGKPSGTGDTARGWLACGQPGRGGLTGDVEERIARMKGLVEAMSRLSSWTPW